MLRGLKPTYIYPQNVDNLCISGQIIPKDVEKAYEQSPEIAAVILTSRRMKELYQIYGKSQMWYIHMAEF